jgi:hypothetical protein
MQLRHKVTLHHIDIDRMTSTPYLIFDWPHSFTEFPQHFIYDMIRRGDTLWLATGSGLVRYNVTDRRSFTLKHNTDKPNGLSHNEILCMAADPNPALDFLWLGTTDGGLNRFSPSDTSFVHFTITEGLASNIISTIFTDEQDNLWLGTNIGIQVLTFSSERDSIVSARTIDQKSGLQDVSFRTFYGRNSSISSTGEFIFCGSNSFHFINPAIRSQREKYNPVFVSGLKVNNAPVALQETHSPLSQPLHFNPAIELASEQNTLTFEITAIDYRDPDKIRYAYKLDGYDQNWIKNGVSRIAHYTKLPSGRYTFRIKTTSNDGIKSEATHPLQIRIATPLWRSTPAFVLYALGIIILFYVMYAIKLKQQRLQYELNLQRIVV